MMYQRHIPRKAPGVYWYYGAGGMMLRMDSYIKSGSYAIAGSVGLEAKINNIPLAIGADISPMYFIGSNFPLVGTGISLRYTFSSQRKTSEPAGAMD